MGILSGKTALITGGNSGIGLFAAKAFASEGAQVVITGRRQRAVEEAVSEIGAGALGIQGDVADVAHHEDVARQIHQRFGAFDIYMANAGVNTITHSSAVSEDEYDAQFSINARGVFFGVQKLIPLMRDAGAVILTGSIASEKVLEGPCRLCRLQGSHRRLRAQLGDRTEIAPHTRQRAQPRPRGYGYSRQTGCPGRNASIL